MDADGTNLPIPASTFVFVHTDAINDSASRAAKGSLLSSASMIDQAGGPAWARPQISAQKKKKLGGRCAACLVRARAAVTVCPSWFITRTGSPSGDWLWAADVQNAAAAATKRIRLAAIGSAACSHVNDQNVTVGQWV